MRVGVYVDGFNLYFGARSVCGRGTPGWRWLDIRALAHDLLTPTWIERGARIERVIYCTARVSGTEDRSSPADQKGTDVNLATHLLVEVLERSVDAAMVISNDSDLELPIRVAREHVPVGVVNPGAGRPAGKLRGQPFEGAGDHWWQRIEDQAYRAHQLPPRVGALRRPPGW